jgi:hypothetical protein
MSTCCDLSLIVIVNTPFLLHWISSPHFWNKDDSNKPIEYSSCLPTTVQVKNAVSEGTIYNHLAPVPPDDEGGMILVH